VFVCVFCFCYKCLNLSALDIRVNDNIVQRKCTDNPNVSPIFIINGMAIGFVFVKIGICYRNVLTNGYKTQQHKHIILSDNQSIICSNS